MLLRGIAGSTRVYMTTPDAWMPSPARATRFRGELFPGPACDRNFSLELLPGLLSNDGIIRNLTAGEA
jgi:hypothetical protein